MTTDSSIHINLFFMSGQFILKPRGQLCDLYSRSSFGQVLSQTEHYRYRVLNAAAKNLDSWFIRVQKMKAIYHTLNKFMYDFAPDCIVAECWIPTSSLDVVQKALTAGMVG